MNTEYLVIDHHAQRQEVEHIGEVVPDVCVTVFSSAFGVESVGLGDTAGFVVSSDQVDSLGVSEFQADEKGDCFDAEEASVDVVTCRLY